MKKFKESGDAKAGGEEVGDGGCAKEVAASLPVEITVEEDV